MGAFWNILIPYRITVSTAADSLKEFEEMYGKDFLFDSKDDEEAENTYILPIEVIRKEFLPFYRILLQEWDALYQAKFRGKFPKQTDNFENRDEILQQIDAVLQKYDFQQEDIQAYLSDIEDNYWVRDEGVPSMVVYEGYPLSDEEHSVIAALVVWSSYEKMHVYTQETLAFHQLIDRLKEKYSDTFTLAKYVFVAGY